MQTFRYRVVDVFTEHALEGNPLAVFPDASGMEETAMQKIGKELNLSETTFVLPATRPNCVARVRIFTPTREMVFAGHPTIGTSWLLLDEKVVPPNTDRFFLDLKGGAIPIRVEPGARPRVWLTTPAIRFEKTLDPAICAKVLGLDRTDLLDVAPQVVTAGNPLAFIALKDKGAVDRAQVDLSGLGTLKEPGEETNCVFVFTPTAAGAYSRMFAPELGVMEDPATGSATGPLAAYMMRNKLAPTAAGTRFYSEQGTKMGRRSILYVQINGAEGADGIEVGGYVTPLVDAKMGF